MIQIRWDVRKKGVTISECLERWTVSDRENCPGEVRKRIEKILLVDGDSQVGDRLRI